MSDGNYVEWLVRRKDPVYAVPVRILMIAVCVFSAFSAPQTVFGVIVMTITGVAAYFVSPNLNVEFEYPFTEGGLSVGRILGRAKRKKVLDCEKDDTQIMVPAGSFMLKDYEKQNMKVEDFPSGKGEAKVYALIYQKGPDYFRVLVEPNEKTIGAMHRTFSRKLVM